MENPITNQTLKPWEQQPGESAKRYSAFMLYCKLGVTRSLETAYELYCLVRKKQKTGNEKAKYLPGFWCQWATEGHWTQRCKAYDNYVIKNSFKLYDEENQEAIAKHYEHRTRDARLMRNANRKILELSFQRLKDMHVIMKQLPSIDCLNEDQLQSLANAYNLNEITKNIEKSTQGLAVANKEEAKTLLIDKLINEFQLILEIPTKQPKSKINNVVNLSDATSKTA